MEEWIEQQLVACFGRGPAGELSQLCRAALAPGRHGDLPRWRRALGELPVAECGWSIHDGAVVAGAPVADRASLTKSLREFIPWRKGPLKLGGVSIDTEWRSDLKWDRIAPHVDLSGQLVLDVGAGNGYFGWRMLDAGADLVVGCDPTLVYYMQHRAVCRFAGAAANLLLPLKLQELPRTLAGFDSVFSMGVLYHRRDPRAHLRDLKRRLRPGGRLVLETLILPGGGDALLVPPGRYANMRNVHAVPGIRRLWQWLDDAGFSNAVVVDQTATTPAEQRSTAWMPFHSLADALDPGGQATVEGHPPPLRAMIRAAG